MSRLISATTGLLFWLLILHLPAAAFAFCGFYVSNDSTKLYNDATRVALMREGTRTVISMRNAYEGPPEDFAMVVPVPEVLQKENVKTLPGEIFEKLEKLTAPRLVEYDEADPCGGLGLYGTGVGGGGYGGMVSVEAEFAVGEYDIVVLSAKESTSLEKWLHANGYEIPKGAAPYFEPYVQQGMYFFVAKVDVDRVTFDDGEAVLSPLRFHYESEDFRLPIRLGLINSDGKQDLIVYTLGRNQRYEVANRKNVFIPTNVRVDEAVRDRFGLFYERLFAKTIEKYPGAAVTEYAWTSSTCDPCPGEALSRVDIATLGGDVVMPRRVSVSTSARTTGISGKDIDPRKVQQAEDAATRCYEASVRKTAPRTGGFGAYWPATFRHVDGTWELAEELDADLSSCLKSNFRRIWRKGGLDTWKVTLQARGQVHQSIRARGWVLTRLHLRYGADDVGSDLVFREADPIVGGREHMKKEEGEGLPQTAREADHNNFQGRYIIRNRWEGEVSCENPNRGVWGQPRADTKAATGEPEKQSKAMTLEEMVEVDVPSIGLRAE